MEATSTSTATATDRAVQPSHAALSTSFQAATLRAYTFTVKQDKLGQNNIKTPYGKATQDTLA